MELHYFFSINLFKKQKKLHYSSSYKTYSMYSILQISCAQALSLQILIWYTKSLLLLHFVI